MGKGTKDRSISNKNINAILRITNYVLYIPYILYTVFYLGIILHSKAWSNSNTHIFQELAGTHIHYLHSFINLFQAILLISTDETIKYHNSALDLLK